MTRIFLTGVTGYVGGQALYSIVKSFPDVSIRALVRDPAKASSLAATFPNVEVVKGALDDASVIREEAKNANVVLNLASISHLESVRAIHEGLKAKGTDRAQWIQMSGGSLFAGPELADDTRIPGSPSEAVYDELDAARIRSWIEQHPSRAVDNYILKVAAEDSNIDTALIISPLIYGLGQGPSNQRSVQIPNLAKAILQRGRGFQLGEGLSRWGNVHVQDLGDFISLLVKAGLEGHPRVDELWNLNGLYLTSVGELVSLNAGLFRQAILNRQTMGLLTMKQSFAEVSQAIATLASSKGLIESTEVEKLNVDEFNNLLRQGTLLYGTNARGNSRRAVEVLGWQPRHADRGLEEAMSRAIEHEAKSLGLVQ